MDGDTGGLASAAGGTDETTIDFSTIVDVGSSANLDVDGELANPGNLSLSALNTFNGYDQVTFKTGGALAGAEALAQIQTNEDLAEVDVEAGATLNSVGQVVLAADGSGDITTQVNTDTYGAVTAAVANSNIYLTPDNQVIVGGNAHHGLWQPRPARRRGRQLQPGCLYGRRLHRCVCRRGDPTEFGERQRLCHADQRSHGQLGTPRSTPAATPI